MLRGPTGDAATNRSIDRSCADRSKRSRPVGRSRSSIEAARQPGSNARRASSASSRAGQHRRPGLVACPARSGSRCRSRSSQLPQRAQLRARPGPRPRRRPASAASRPTSPDQSRRRVRGRRQAAASVGRRRRGLAGPGADLRRVRVQTAAQRRGAGAKVGAVRVDAAGRARRRIDLPIRSARAASVERVPVRRQRQPRDAGRPPAASSHRLARGARPAPPVSSRQPLRLDRRVRAERGASRSRTASQPLARGRRSPDSAASRARRVDLRDRQVEHRRGRRTSSPGCCAAAKAGDRSEWPGRPLRSSAGSRASSSTPSGSPSRDQAGQRRPARAASGPRRAPGRAPAAARRAAPRRAGGGACPAARGPHRTGGPRTPTGGPGRAGPRPPRRAARRTARRSRAHRSRPIPAGTSSESGTGDRRTSGRGHELAPRAP